MKFILTTKEKMTRVFADDGRAYAGTILSADPVTVTQVKTKEGKDGYVAVQVGAGERRAKNINKPFWATSMEACLPVGRDMRQSAKADSIKILQKMYPLRNVMSFSKTIEN